MAGFNGGILGSKLYVESGMFTMDELPHKKSLPPGTPSHFFMIAGGGGGGHTDVPGGVSPGDGGGGGAGGYLTGTASFVAGTKYDIVIGAPGGARETDGSTGHDTIVLGFGSVKGGGAGGSFSRSGGAGGSGGGHGAAGGNAGKGTVGQGHDGYGRNGGGAGGPHHEGVKNPIQGSTIGRLDPDGVTRWIGEGGIGGAASPPQIKGSGNGGESTGSGWSSGGASGSFVFEIPTSKLNVAGLAGTFATHVVGSKTVVEFTGSGSYTHK